MKGVRFPKGTRVRPHLPPSAGLLGALLEGSPLPSILSSCSSQQLPSSLVMVITESHERVGCVNVREAIHAAGRVGRQDPHLSPIFPEESVYKAQFENH